jgi:hypothetical protein
MFQSRQVCLTKGDSFHVSSEVEMVGKLYTRMNIAIICCKTAIRFARTASSAQSHPINY